MKIARWLGIFLVGCSGSPSTEDPSETTGAGLDEVVDDDGGSSPAQPGGDTEPAIVRGVTEAHNVVRRPLGLPDLRYDTALEAEASLWADVLVDRGCILEHNYDSPLGENLYWTSGQATPGEVVASWASEVRDYDYDSNTCAEGKMCGHYTQIVWRDTARVGCAVASCGADGEIWMCTYDPAGNWQGERPY